MPLFKRFAHPLVSGYGYLLQAGSIGNDLFAAVFALAVVDLVRRSLRPGGVFAFWEINPWNPGTRHVMSRIPFDRDAIMLTPPEARWL